MSISSSNTYDTIEANPSNLTLLSFRENDPKKNNIFTTKSIHKNISTIAAQLIDSCAICLSKKRNPIEIQNCHHIFCSECIKKWSKISKSCPLCKSNIISLNPISY